jgi:triacylglycerol lipase
LVLCAASLALVSVLAASTAVQASATSNGSTAYSPYPVRWDFLANAIEAASHDGPDVPPPGSDVPCVPSAAHPLPVVLVHGLGADQNDNWGAISPFLADSGYCVFSLTYGNDASGPGFSDQIGGLSDMAQSAQTLASFVQSVLAATGAPKVDIVGHSEGGTMPDWYLKFDGGNAVVAHFVALSGVMHGTTLWGLSGLYALGQAYGGSAQVTSALSSFCASCLEFLPTSPWMEALDAAHPAASPGEAATCPTDGAAVDGVAYTSIATRDDELVRPPTSDFIDPACATAASGISVDNILVQQQCPQDQSDHLSVAADPNVAQDILNALDPSDAQPVHCSVVLPSIG